MPTDMMRAASIINACVCPKSMFQSPWNTQKNRRFQHNHGSIPCVKPKRAKSFHDRLTFKANFGGGYNFKTG